VQLVGFSIGMYNDARSSECQIRLNPLRSGIFSTDGVSALGILNACVMVLCVLSVV